MQRSTAEPGSALPNSVREALLGSGMGKALIVVEALYLLGFSSETWLTFDEIHTLLQEHCGTSSKSVREGLLIGSVFQRRRSKATGKRGQRPYLYRLPHRDELICEFAPGTEHVPSDPLELSDLKNLTTLRLGLHRELYIRKWLDNKGRGFTMARGLQADRLGVSPRSIRRYDKKLGFSSRPNFKQVEVTYDNCDHLPRYAKRFDEAGNVTPRKQWLQIENWRTGEVRSLPLVRYLAFRSLGDGYQVHMVERLPNTYFPYQLPEGEPQGNWDTDYYFKEQAAIAKAGFVHSFREGWKYKRKKISNMPPDTLSSDPYKREGDISGKNLTQEFKNFGNFPDKCRK